MTTDDPELIGRDELARMLNLKKLQVARNEKHLGILDFKVFINPRLVMYRREETIAALILKGLLRKLRAESRKQKAEILKHL